MSDLQTDDPKTGDEATEELTVEQLQEQLEHKEHDIQLLKGTNGQTVGELKKEIELLKQQQYQSEGRISEQREMMSPKEKAKDPYEFDEETIEKFSDSPIEIVHFLKEREAVMKREQSDLTNLVVEALHELNSDMQGKFTGLRKEVDPEIQAWKPAIEELKKSEELKDLDESKLIAIAKRMDMKPLMEYRGTAGGQRGREPEQKARQFDSQSSGGQMLLKMFDGDVKKAQSAWDRAEAKKGLK